MVYTFGRAVETLGNLDQKKVDNNTYLMRKDNDTFAIRLHGTTVEIHRDGTYGLFSGGYHTMTTKSRINEYAPAGVYQRKKGKWFVNRGIPFKEGIRVDKNGSVIF